MRHWQKVVGWVVALLLSASIVSCGGGGGGGSSAGSLVISNLIYNPKAAYVNTGGGQITVNGSLDYANASGGPASITLDALDSGGTVIDSTPSTISGGAGNPNGTILLGGAVSTAVVGNYTVRVTLKDAAGRTSNALTGTFRIADQPWVAKVPMPHSRSQFATALSGGQAYVIGGELLGTGTTPGPDSALVDVYDPATNTWAAGIPMPARRVAPAAATVNDVIYVIGGHNLGAPGGLTTVEAFDPSTNLWTPKASMPTPRRYAAASVIGGQICVFGGDNAGLDVSTTECYDPVGNSWSTKTSMSTARRLLGADTIGAFAYAVGGYGTLAIPQFLASVERFDFANNSWASVDSMSTGRDSAGILSASGLLYAIGGANVARALNSVEAYDPSTGHWTPKTAMPISLTGVKAVTVGSLVYVFEASHTLEYTPANDIQ